MTAAIIALARRFGRYGYRKITDLLEMAGWTVNAKRVQRIWRQEGLKVPSKQPKRKMTTECFTIPNTTYCSPMARRLKRERLSEMRLFSPSNQKEITGVSPARLPNKSLCKK